MILFYLIYKRKNKMGVKHIVRKKKSIEPIVNPIVDPIIESVEEKIIIDEFPKPNENLKRTKKYKKVITKEKLELPIEEKNEKTIEQFVKEKPIVKKTIKTTEEQSKIMHSKTNSKTYDKFIIPIIEEPIEEHKKVEESNWKKVLKWFK